MKKIVIFDLDGTLALIDKRRELAKNNGKFNWDVFFSPENISLDEPNVPVIEMSKILKNAGYEIYIFSGRSAVSFNETVEWLNKHEVPFDLLKMRPIKDYTPDDKLKRNWLHSMKIKDLVLTIFDDRDKVVKMWRDEGLSVFQVNYGNF